MEGGLDGADLYGELSRTVASEVGYCVLVCECKEELDMAYCIHALRALKCEWRRRGLPSLGRGIRPALWLSRGISRVSGMIEI